MDPQAHEDRFTARLNKWLKECSDWTGPCEKCPLQPDCEQAYKLILNCHDQGHFRVMGAGQKGSNPENIPTQL